MTVLYCEQCCELMRAREPFQDWSVVYGVCAACLVSVLDRIYCELVNKSQGRPPFEREPEA